MKKMKKLAFCLMALVFVLALSACHVKTSLTYKFDVDNGDTILIKLDTTDKFKMTTDVPFSISQDGKELAQGSFLQLAGYDQYAEAAKNDEKATVLDSGTKDGNEYVFWSYDNKEFNYVIKVKDANTAVALGSIVSEDAARECFNRMTIEFDK